MSDLLNNLSPEELSLIEETVVAPITLRKQVTNKNKFTKYLVNKYQGKRHYAELAEILLSLLRLAFNDNDPLNRKIKETKVYQRCEEKDRLKAIMVAVKNLTENVYFKDTTLEDKVKDINKYIDLEDLS